MSWLHYLIEANIYLGVFYLCYCLFLNNETHYTLSRAYLLFSCVISFVLPLTQLSILKPADFFADGQTMAYINTGAAMQQIAPPPPPVEPHITWQDASVYAYIIGAAIALAVFMFRLYRLFKLMRRTKEIINSSYRVIHLQDENTAFSFFNYLFIGSNTAQYDTIIAHELVHIRQKHSWDIMLLEILKVVSWFNPFIYLTQRSLKTVHEYIADEQTAAHERDALSYSSFILNNAYGIQGSTIAHSFFNYNLLKKRIIMLNKNRSGKLARLKYLAVLPLCGGMLCASTLAFSKEYGWIDLSPKALSTQSDTTKRKLLPPPPPAPPKVNMSKLQPPPMPSKVKSHMLPPPPPPVDKRHKAARPIQPPVADGAAMLPPPPPHDTAYSKLFNYMGRHVRYPTAARKNNVGGNVIISYRLTGEHKITDIKVMDGIGKGCDEEVIRALKTFTGAISRTPGTYYFATTFVIDGYTKKFEPVGKIGDNPNFAGTVVILGGYNPIKVLPNTNGKANSGNSEPTSQKPAMMPNSSRALLISESQQKKPVFKISSINSPTFNAIDKNKSLRIKALPNRGGSIVEIMDKSAVPMVFVNRTRHLLKDDLKKGEHLYMTASDSMIIHTKGEVYASNKWGDAAKNGVVELFGQTSVYIK